LRYTLRVAIFSTTPVRNTFLSDQYIPKSSRGSKLVLEARPEEGRGRGRPRLEWEEYVEGLARKRGRKLPDVKRLAQVRKEYRKWLLLEPDD
jgi:hypothetical protein